MRRIHVTLRGPDWETVEPRLESAEVTEEGEQTTIRFVAAHGDRPVLFRWHGTVVLRPGRLEYSVEGTAESEFEHSRLGLCVLHPSHEYAGRPFEAEGPSGRTKGTLSELVAAQPVVDWVQQALFAPMASLAVTLAEGVRLRFEFEGDLFEMEDQRNWTDASFKSYCTPLAVPFPRRTRPGDSVVQRVVLEVDTGSARPRPPRETTEVTLGRPCGVVPPFGVTALDAAAPIELARELAPTFLRAEVDVGPGAESALAEFGRLATEIGSALEVALYAPRGDDDALAALAPALASARPARVVVLHREEDVTDDALVRALAERLPGVTIGRGTNRHFVDVNRNRPDQGCALLCWPMDPQAHATDDRSILETAEVHQDLVRTARSFAPSAQLTVWAQLVRAPQTDARQATAFPAAFMLASAAQLAAAGIAAAAFHELWGPRGVAWDGEDGSWGDLSGTRSPAFHVLRGLAGLAGQELLSTASPAGVAVLAARDSTYVTLMLANLRAEPREVPLAPLADRVVLSRPPEAGREEAWPRALELGPYEVALARVELRRLVRGIQ